MPKQRCSHSQFIDKLRQKEFDFSKIEIDGFYFSGQTPIQCRCLKCDFVWHPKPENLLRGCGCPSCAGKTLDNDSFMNRLRKNNPHFNSINFLEKYRGYNYTMLCECKVCGFRWNAQPSVLLRGSRCSRCSNQEKGLKKTLSHSEFLKKFNQSNNAKMIELLDVFHGYDAKIKCQCKLCGHIWFPTGNNLIKGKGCPSCSHMQTSFAEQFIYLALVHVLGNESVLGRNKKAIGREIDIYIPKYNFALEIGSWYWHQKRLATDYEKYVRCNNLGIELWTIFDGCSLVKNSISEPPFENCFIYQHDLGSEENNITLKKLVNAILIKIGQNINITDIEWNQISQQATIHSHSKNNSNFAEELSQKNPFAQTIEILGQVVNRGRKTHCRCKLCGHDWFPRVQHLLSGHGCPKCQREKIDIAKRKKEDDFLYEFQKNNSHAKDIIFLEKYVAMSKRIKCQCNVCSNIWEPLASNLARLGTGCPLCARKNYSRKKGNNNIKSE